MAEAGMSCSVQANQAGNATYSAAPTVAHSFTVSKASQTISFGALANKTLAQSPVTVSATATSGLAVSFTT
ncbi:MAG: midcut-by-XrtH protein, partial [Acidimicrobiales bacterium]